MRVRAVPCLPSIRGGVPTCNAQGLPIETTAQGSNGSVVGSAAKAESQKDIAIFQHHTLTAIIRINKRASWVVPVSLPDAWTRSHPSSERHRWDNAPTDLWSQSVGLIKDDLTDGQHGVGGRMILGDHIADPCHQTRMVGDFRRLKAWMGWLQVSP